MANTNATKAQQNDFATWTDADERRRAAGLCTCGRSGEYCDVLDDVVCDRCSARTAAAAAWLEPVRETGDSQKCETCRYLPQPSALFRVGCHCSSTISAIELGRRDCKVLIAETGGYELVLIPGGTFRMGSPPTEEGRFVSEGPQHEVEISRFYLGRYPVTNEEYRRFLEANPGTTEPEYWGDRRYNQPRQPVVGVSWDDASRYAEWAGLRLPTEAEWECACRAGTTTRYHSGDNEEDLARVGWYKGNSEDRLHPVGEKEANGFGLFDMHGNVWEWCADWWQGDYKAAGTVDPAGPPTGQSRVFRGGCAWYSAWNCRSASRSGWLPGDRRSDQGFRPAAGQPVSKETPEG